MERAESDSSAESDVPLVTRVKVLAEKHESMQEDARNNWDSLRLCIMRTSATNQHIHDVSSRLTEQESHHNRLVDMVNRDFVNLTALEKKVKENTEEHEKNLCSLEERVVAQHFDISAEKTARIKLEHEFEEYKKEKKIETDQLVMIINLITSRMDFLRFITYQCPTIKEHVDKMVEEERKKKEEDGAAGAGAPVESKEDGGETETNCADVTVNTPVKPFQPFTVSVPVAIDDDA